ncbi:class I SAM-dependent methyltransferase [Kytococcus sedentarius]|uniref:class I SAM-dependent methyltransferase n=1 Tax=Kytococcus sedentarius TaxID=1276 RepID=UPI0035BC05A0
MHPIDQLLWDEAPREARAVAVLDAPDLVGSARALSQDVRVWCDDWRDAHRVPEDLRVEPGELAGVDLALGHLPKSLDALDEQLAALGDDPGLTYLGGARIRHLNRSMNDVLARHFGEVTASLGRQKCRVLRARRPLDGVSSPAWPRTRIDEGLGLTLAAHGATFGGARVDRGTRLLLQYLDVAGQDVLDLGCGNGVIAAALARSGHRVQARDVSWSAVAATRATAAANGLEVDVSWGDGLAGLPASSLDAIVTNPPFHRGFAKESADTLAMFTDAARVLRPGGQLWCVFNSHLPWRSELQRRLGPTRLVTQDRHYTVTLTTRG